MARGIGLRPEVHADRACVCDIRVGIESQRNTSFVVHDSQGYAPGETDNYDTVQGLIAEAEARERIADKLRHLVVHRNSKCKHPCSSDLQKGAETMLRSHGNSGKVS